MTVLHLWGKLLIQIALRYCCRCIAWNIFSFLFLSGRVFSSLPEKRENENKVFYILSPKNGSENKGVFFLPEKTGVKIKFFIFSPWKNTGGRENVFFLISTPQRAAVKIILVILFVKKGYGLVSARSRPYHTWPLEAEFDMAGFSQTPGRISFLQRG